jgi:hypothetical protein
MGKSNFLMRTLIVQDMKARPNLVHVQQRLCPIEQGRQRLAMEFSCERFGGTCR